MTRKPEILGADGRPMRRASSVPADPGGFRGAGHSSASVAGWMPAMRSADGAHAASHRTLVARARDLFRNAAHFRRAARLRADLEIGPGLVLQPTPDADALGIDAKAARDLGRRMSALFREWATDPGRRCDVRARLSFGAMTWASVVERQQSGEHLAVLRWKERPGWRWRTCVQLVDPDRLSTPMGRVETANLHGGVETDDDGEPIAYHIQQAHPADPWSDAIADRMKWERVEARTEWGRPIIMHGFEIDRVEASRGTPPVAALLAEFKNLDDYARAELGRATVNAMIVAVFESGLDPASAGELLGPMLDGGEDSIAAQWHAWRGDWYGANKPAIGADALRVPVLPPGDKLNINTNPGQAGGFKDFEAAFLRRLAVGFDVPAPALSEDWTGVTYSSARAADVISQRTARRSRQHFAESFAMPIYHAVMEEAVARGWLMLPADGPDFWENPSAYLRAEIIGPAPGHVDPEKAARASETALANDLTSLAREAAERGMTLETLFAELAREKELREEFGLPPRQAEPARLEPVDVEDEDARIERIEELERRGLPAPEGEG